MKKKLKILLIIASLTIIFYGCENNQQNKSRDFVVYGIDNISEKYEVTVTEVNQLFIYIPILTNMQILETKISRYGVLTYPKNPVGNSIPDIKVNLSLCSEQKELNYLYRDKYISFVKIDIEIESFEKIADYNKITFVDTVICVSNDEDELNIPLPSNFLEIYFDGSKIDMKNIDWREKIGAMKTKMQNQINHILSF